MKSLGSGKFKFCAAREEEEDRTICKRIHRIKFDLRRIQKDIIKTQSCLKQL